MDALITLLTIFAQESGPGEGSGDVLPGLLLIFGALAAAIIAIALIWTFAAKRGSRTPRHDPQERDHVGS